MSDNDEAVTLIATEAPTSFHYQHEENDDDDMLDPDHQSSSAFGAYNVNEADDEEHADYGKIDDNNAYTSDMQFVTANTDIVGRVDDDEESEEGSEGSDDSAGDEDPAPLMVETGLKTLGADPASFQPEEDSESEDDEDFDDFDEDDEYYDDFQMQYTDDGDYDDQFMMAVADYDDDQVDSDQEIEQLLHDNSAFLNIALAEDEEDDPNVHPVVKAARRMVKEQHLNSHEDNDDLMYNEEEESAIVQGLLKSLQDMQADWIKKNEETDKLIEHIDSLQHTVRHAERMAARKTVQVERLQMRMASVSFGTSTWSDEEREQLGVSKSKSDGADSEDEEEDPQFEEGSPEHIAYLRKLARKQAKKNKKKKEKKGKKAKAAKQAFSAIPVPVPIPTPPAIGAPAAVSLSPTATGTISADDEGVPVPAAAAPEPDEKAPQAFNNAIETPFGETSSTGSASARASALNLPQVGDGVGDESVVGGIGAESEDVEEKEFIVRVLVHASETFVDEEGNESVGLKMVGSKKLQSPRQAAFLQVISERNHAQQRVRELEQSLSNAQSQVLNLQNRLQETTKMVEKLAAQRNTDEKTFKDRMAKEKIAIERIAHEKAAQAVARQVAQQASGEGGDGEGQKPLTEEEQQKLREQEYLRFKKAQLRKVQKSQTQLRKGKKAGSEAGTATSSKTGPEQPPTVRRRRLAFPGLGGGRSQSGDKKPVMRRLRIGRKPRRNTTEANETAQDKETEIPNAAPAETDEQVPL